MTYNDDIHSKDYDPFNDPVERARELAYQNHVRELAEKQRKERITQEELMDVLLDLLHQQQVDAMAVEQYTRRRGIGFTQSLDFKAEC